jgi:hypothetical protein
MRLRALQGRYEWYKKIFQAPGCEPRTVQDLASRYTDCAIPASFYFKVLQLVLGFYSAYLHYVLERVPCASHTWNVGIAMNISPHKESVQVFCSGTNWRDTITFRQNQRAMIQRHTHRRRVVRTPALYDQAFVSRPL